METYDEFWNWRTLLDTAFPAVADIKKYQCYEIIGSKLYARAGSFFVFSN